MEIVRVAIDRRPGTKPGGSGIASPWHAADSVDPGAQIAPSTTHAYEIEGYRPILIDLTFALQDRKVVEKVGKIIGMDPLEPDPHLYAPDHCDKRTMRWRF